MQLYRKFNESAGKPNDLSIGYSPRVDTYSQQMLGLRNHFLYMGKALQDVSGLTPIEIIKPGGPDTVTRTARHIAHGAIAWPDVLRVMDDLITVGKLQVNAEKRDLLLYLLRESLIVEAGIGYSFKTE